MGRVLGAEVAGHYKPQPEAYPKAAALLGLPAGSCMIVAAHNDGLAAAAACGRRTAFVRRPKEHGPRQQTDLKAEGDWDFVAEDFSELAEQMDC